LVLEQVLQNAPDFAFFSGICSETEVSEQLYLNTSLRGGEGNGNIYGEII
jgi:hypothetical protein